MRPAAYLVLFFVSAGLALLAGSFGWWGASVLSCPPAPPGTFLAYCRNEQYGDFEHGAYLYGLEPAAIDAARRADAIVVGDSRAQFAFSTDAVHRYFTGRHAAHYLLGMGYGSTSPYADELLRRHGLRPRVLIVNAEPFFTREMTAVPAAVLRAEAGTRWAYWRKQQLARVHGALCERLPALCRQSPGGIHRRVDDGAWIWDGLLVPGSVSLPFAEQTIADEEQEEAPRVAKAFVDDLAINGRCVLVTAVPGLSADSRRVATAVAQAIGGVAILPEVAGLASLDGDHLNAASAEAWSAAFLRDADAALTACLSDHEADRTEITKPGPS